MYGHRPLGREHRVDIVTGIILSLVTCGVYNLVWQYKQMRAVNALLGREEYNFVAWLLLTIVTCGIYHFYYEYKMGTDITRIARSLGQPVTNDLGVIGLLLSFFATTLVADAIYQSELNKLIAE
jgi:hypothetical protein